MKSISILKAEAAAFPRFAFLPLSPVSFSVASPFLLLQQSHIVPTGISSVPPPGPAVPVTDMA